MPPSLPHNLHLRPATATDIPTITALAIDLFANSDHMRLFNPTASLYPETHYQWCLHRYRTRFYAADLQMQVLEDTSTPNNDIIGCLLWTPEGPSALYDRVLREKHAQLCIPGVVERWVLKAERQYWQWFLLRQRDLMEVGKVMKRAEETWERSVGETRLHLDILLVRRDYQGKGVGKALLLHTMDLARREGMPVVLESTAEGKPMYEKYGFSVVGDLGPEGGDVSIPAMVWKPGDS